MKEVVEYVLAVLIVLSILPFYNMVATQFYTPTKGRGTVAVGDIFVSAVSLAFRDAYNNGNTSIEVAEVRSSLDSLIRRYAGSAYDEYYYYARLYSPINVTLDPTGRTVTVYSPFNMTTYLLLVSWNGAASISLQLNPVKAGDVFKYTYNYSALSFKGVSVAVAVSGYGSTWFIGYWLNESSTMGYIVAAPGGLLTVLADRNAGLKPTSFYNYTGFNSTIYYVATQGLANYTRSWTNITIKMIVSGDIVSYMEYNTTETMYLGEKKTYNSSMDAYTLYLAKGRSYWVYSEGRSRLVENATEKASVNYPIYNMVLATIYDGARVIYAPAYRNNYTVTNAPEHPPGDADRVSSYVTIGMFTYMVDLWSWRRS
ncbi:hypothetical protein [Desulfurococcus mucosus]|uniref:Uncharacterized protein n=1 Tax=Desulfurococcus mucosus (strain ATCC 35584 / DSM 2162 / JCM 9187 / O7/1) TaxID=765177 RepID=E8R7X4_DESM0|nr:hypothetical protein [Desulfurococcus mucosus]ADV64600.1 hypothetical protein Desmu_0281 [Desulfurococcus mucosus DSM 2162]